MNYSYFLSQSSLLITAAKLEEFLDNIVAKYISHEIVSSGKDFIKDHLFFGGSSAFQFLLNEPRSVLILREFHYVVGEISAILKYIL